MAGTLDIGAPTSVCSEDPAGEEAVLAPTNGNGCGSIAGTIAAADPDSALVGLIEGVSNEAPAAEVSPAAPEQAVPARSSGSRDPDGIHITWS